MAAMAAHAFAERGWVVLQPDLMGCGDSAGDFGDATWTAWLDDISRTWGWLRDRGYTRLVLWTLRAGSLLAADWLETSGERPPLLMWQPIVNGQQHLTQFLRLKAAAEMRSPAEGNSALARLRADIESKRAVEVAGYRLSPDLAAGLSAATLRVPDTHDAPVVFLEVTSSERTEPSAALSSLLARSTERRVPPVARVVRGPSFWQTLLVEVAPELIPASLAELDRLPA
jgi:exosortase A-associated hydrolase 2